MRFALGIVCVVVLVVLAAPAGAAPPRASLPDIEDEVMCAECGTPLNVSGSPVAEEERELIRSLIAQGKTKEQIKDALVSEYGPAILALPEEKGVSLGAYLGPAALVLVGLLVLATTARRWRRAAPVVHPAEEPPLDPDDARRLDAELARIDP